MKNVCIARPPQVFAQRGIAKSQHYADVANGLFTPPIKLGLRAAGWPQHEVDALVAAKIAGKSNDEIKRLVSELTAQRIGLLDAVLRGAA